MVVWEWGMGVVVVVVEVITRWIGISHGAGKARIG